METALNVKSESQQKVRQHKVKKTPFIIIEHEKNGEKEFFGALGNYRLTPTFNRKYKTKWWMRKNKMEILTTYISIIAEKVYDIKRNEWKKKLH